MPEISEVARIVHYIRKHLVNKTVTKVSALHDDIVYGKVGTSAAEFEKNVMRKKIVDAGQQGKYFWMIMSSPPHPVMHFGMSGWFKLRGQHTYYYRKKDNDEIEEWPPKYTKFSLTAKGDDGSEEEAAFVDARRLARIRLIDCDGKDIRKHSPLKENGPDPVIDKDIVSLEWLTEKCRKKKVPIKAMLLDQSVISGIGNWVGDEIMYHAKMHPEQYANTLSDKQIAQLHESIHYVCGLACELLADSDQFPEDWLFKHRWGKGKVKGDKKLPNGNKIVFLTVGGRTSAVVPAVQKKTGAVAGDLENDSSIDDTEEEKAEDPKPQKQKKTKGKKRMAEDDEMEDQEVKQTAPKTTSRKAKTNGVKQEEVVLADSANKKGRKRQKTDPDVEAETETRTDPPAKKAPAPARKTEKVKSTDLKTKQPVRKESKSSKIRSSKPVKDEIDVQDNGRRRSGRLKKKA